MTAGKVFSVSSQEKDLSKFALAIQQLANGRSNATGLVTLAASATSTTVSNINCATGSTIYLTATTANAAAALATTYIAPATVTKQQFVITHASNSQTDRTFFYVVLG
jgi:ABC-type branched-subunit amino acid transport system substrate-binding protein